MKAKDPPPAEYQFVYATPPRSGNEINGLNLQQRRRPEKIAPDDFTVEDYPWKSLWDFFFMTLPWVVIKQFIMGMFESRKATGPVAPERVAVDDAGAMTEQIKKYAKQLGAGIVGITQVSDDLLLYEDDTPHPYTYAISMGVPMDREKMEQVPKVTAGVEVVRVYRESSKVANQLAKYIRAMGWPAEAFALGRDILQIPTAIQAGLGELGKHGSLISKEFGSNFRLVLVLTDLPMHIDAPIDIGVQGVCRTCRAYTINCPPDAISDTKQLVRGVEKWYVDYDKCAYYFAKTVGCSICVEVCPWSEPGRGPKLSELVLKKRT